MTDWNVIISDDLAESGKAFLRQHATVSDRAGISAEELQAEIGEAHALVVRGRTKITPELLQAAPNLKVVGRAGVGVDNIDLAASQKQGLIVVNTPSATTDAVAEHTLGLMLSLARHITHADSDMKAGLWNKQKFLGVELGGKTLGIVGVGRIGHSLAQLALAFGMKVLGHDPFLDDQQIQQKGAQPVELYDLYAQADFISLHLPLTPETRGMIDDDVLNRMKRGVYLLCAARGGIINETALLARLESGQVAGAALDVFAKEPPGLTALVAHPHVVATPHIGAQTEQAQARAAQHVAEEIISALNGEPLRWRVV